MTFEFMLFGLIASYLLIGASAGFAEDDPPPGTALTTEQRVFIFSTFWKEVSYNFAHWETAGDLAAV